MSKIASRFTLNLDILRQCREQMGLEQAEIEKKVKIISDIEEGIKLPTYKQLDILAELYQVPRWVFIAEKLPEEYQYKNTPAFRKFKDSSVFENAKVRKLVARVEQYRNLFIELRNDLDDPLHTFTPPAMGDTNNVKKMAGVVRQWLSISNNEYLDFINLKERLREKNIFIFLTGKYKGWSHVDMDFRGLSIVHSTMPVIIINDSDSKKAQSFTLMHELGHILRKDTAIDGENTDDSTIEKWCDNFAGEVLMPASSAVWNSLTDTELADTKRLAKQFKVSPYACLVRLKQLGKINQQTYDNQEKKLRKEYEESKEKLKNSAGGPARNRSKEVKMQFGVPFINTLLNAWHSEEITLHKAAKLLDLKHPRQFLDLNGGFALNDQVKLKTN